MDDLIRREDAIKAVWGDDINPSGDGMVFEAQSHIDREMRLIPSADRPQGEWMAKNSHTMYCSVCGFEEEAWRTQDYGYCPNCGADMRGDDHE